MANLDSEASRGWTTSEVVALLESVESKPLSAADAQTLKACLASLATVKPGSSECPGCKESVSRGEEARHAERCLRFPARLRHEALVRAAARLVAQRGGADSLEPLPPLEYPPPDVAHRCFVPFSDALRRLGVDADLDQQSRAQYASVVLRELRWRLHVVERDTEPCPWCRAVLPVEGFREHVWSCEAHPASRRAVALSDALRERFGDVAVDAALEEEAVASARAAVRALVAACGKYSGSMGYYGDGEYYTKHWSEAPWRAALDLAECIARDARAAPMSPAVERHVTTLAALIKQSRSFWNRMGDDDGGRSIIKAEACTAWEAHVAAAAATLDGA